LASPLSPRRSLSHPITELKLAYIVYAVIFGVVGVLLAFFAELSMKTIGKIMEKSFHDKVVLRAFDAGVVIAIVGYFIPNLLFSGENQIHSIIQNASEIGIAMLLLMAVLEDTFACSFAQERLSRRSNLPDLIFIDDDCTRP
jgi:chloride channel protein, CIC family